MADMAPTPAAPDREIVNAVFDLEGDVCDLVNMARILAELMDDNLQPEPHEDGLVIHIGRQHLDMLSFAWNDVANKANAFKERYYAALDGRAAA